MFSETRRRQLFALRPVDSHDRGSGGSGSLTDCPRAVPNVAIFESSSMSRGANFLASPLLLHLPLSLSLSILIPSP